MKRVRRRRPGAKVVAVATAWPLTHIPVLRGISTSCTKLKSKPAGAKTSLNRDSTTAQTACHRFIALYCALFLLRFSALRHSRWPAGEICGLESRSSDTSPRMAHDCPQGPVSACLPGRRATQAPEAPRKPGKPPVQSAPSRGSCSHIASVKCRTWRLRVQQTRHYPLLDAPSQARRAALAAGHALGAGTSLLSGANNVRALENSRARGHFGDRYVEIRIFGAEISL